LQRSTQTLSEQLDIYPDHAVASLRLGEVLWEQGRRTEAIEAWSGITNAKLYFVNKGAQFAEEGEVVKAEKCARIVQVLEPNIVGNEFQMYQGLCKAYRDRNELSKALPWCERAAASRRNGWAQIVFADVQYELGNYNDALKTLKMALQVGLPETFGPTYQKIGQVHIAMGNLREGISAYEKALELGRSNRWLYISLARALLRMDEVHSACYRFAQAIDLGYVPNQSDQIDFAVCRP